MAPYKVIDQEGNGDALGAYINERRAWSVARTRPEFTVQNTNWGTWWRLFLAPPVPFVVLVIAAAVFMAVTIAIG